MAIISGNNTNSILPYIDYVYLKHHPKVIIDYSYVTAPLPAIYKKTGLVTFCGLAAASFGEFPPFIDWTFVNFDSMIKNQIMIPQSYKKSPFWTDEFIDCSTQNHGKAQYENDWICVQSGVCGGRLIGGNLNTFQGFFGTEYMPQIREGDVLFIEDSLKIACTIEHSFFLLKLAGVFGRISGIILGKHEKI